MPLITLISDFGTLDPHVAAVKGSLYSENELFTIVDVSHEIDPFHLQQASFVLKYAYSHFPEGTLHLIFVDEEKKPNRQHLVVKANGHYFIGADNGMLSLMDIVPEEIYEIDLTNSPELVSSKQIFSRVAGHISRGGSLSLIGRKRDGWKELAVSNPIVSEGGIQGSVVYVDHYGNVITNIHQSAFTSASKGRSFEIELNRLKTMKKISKSFSEASNGDLVAVFNHEGFLKIGIINSVQKTHSSAHSLLGLKVNDVIRINFSR